MRDAESHSWRCKKQEAAMEEETLDQHEKGSWQGK